MRKWFTFFTIFSSILILLPITSYSLIIDQPDKTAQKLNMQPELIKQTAPVYPSDCKQKGIEGKVNVRALVNLEGDVVKTVIAESSGNTALDQSALDAVLLFKFKPGIQNDQPVDTWVEIPIIFELAESNPNPDEFIQVDKMPELITNVSPEYPIKAKRDGKEGYVWVKALISLEGSVLKAHVTKSSCSTCNFDESALKAAFQNKFKPALKDGKPIAVWVTYKVQFKLD